MVVQFQARVKWKDDASTDRCSQVVDCQTKHLPRPKPPIILARKRSPFLFSCQCCAIFSVLRRRHHCRACGNLCVLPPTSRPTAYPLPPAKYQQPSILSQHVLRHDILPWPTPSSVQSNHNISTNIIIHYYFCTFMQGFVIVAATTAPTYPPWVRVKPLPHTQMYCWRAT